MALLWRTWVDLEKKCTNVNPAVDSVDDQKVGFILIVLPEGHEMADVAQLGRDLLQLVRIYSSRGCRVYYVSKFFLVGGNDLPVKGDAVGVIAAGADLTIAAEE